MYAVVQAGGKQHRVEPDAVFDVELLGIAPGEQVVLDKVLLIGGDERLVGTPFVEGAKVVCRALSEVKNRKVIAFRYKRKENIRKKRGHRQRLTRMIVESIETGRGEKSE
jgi:large subunit ribosomal protein L21